MSAGCCTSCTPVWWHRCRHARHGKADLSRQQSRSCFRWGLKISWIEDHFAKTKISKYCLIGRPMRLQPPHSHISAFQVIRRMIKVFNEIHCVHSNFDIEIFDSTQLKMRGNWLSCEQTEMWIPKRVQFQLRKNFKVYQECSSPIRYHCTNTWNSEYHVIVRHIYGLRSLY